MQSKYRVLALNILFLSIWSHLYSDENNPFGMPPGSPSSTEKHLDQQKKEVEKTVIPKKPTAASQASQTKEITVQDASTKKEYPAAESKEDKSFQVTSGIGFKKENEANQQTVDTVNVKSTSGNWVSKNYWWRNIEDVYNEIKGAFNTVMTSRMAFFSQRTDVDKELDRFYQHVGLEQGPLQDIINLALEVIEKEKAKQGFLTKKERIFFTKIKNKQHQFEQLKKDVLAIEEVDHKIDAALEVVLEQINLCSKYEQEAWKSLKSVAHELSDKQARKEYYQVKAFLEDVNKIDYYLKNPFQNYFNQLIQSVDEHTHSIITKLTLLKKDGVELKKEVEFFEKEIEEIEEQVPATTKTKPLKKATKEPTFFRKVVKIVSDKIQYVVIKVKSIFGFEVKKVELVEKEIAKSV